MHGWSDVAQLLVKDFAQDRFRSIAVILTACWAGHAYGGVTGMILAPAAWLAVLVLATVAELRKRPRRNGRRRRR